MNLREKKTHKYLEELGFVVHTVTKPSRIGLNHDLFGLWDHIAVAKEDFCLGLVQGNVIISLDKGDCMFVQTKSRKQYGKDIAKYVGFPSDNKFIFVWKKNKSNRYELIVQKLK
ncbi:MAG: hypothetical protein KA799_01340 [Bacteroidales bacterium]|nr:hypothetical protein [Bacteroidales bacterium]